MKKILLLSLTLFLLNSCANIFNGLVLPNQCKRCEVVDQNTGDVLWSIEGCGSENTGLEDKAKIQAYDLSGGNLCNLSVQCESWKQDPEEEE